MTIKRGESPGVEIRMLNNLVRMAERRRANVEQARAARNTKLVAIIGSELRAITWALDRLGYPPARYAEIVEKFRGRSVAYGPGVSPPAPVDDADPVEVTRSQRLWQQVKDEEAI